MPATDVLFYQDEDGTAPVLEWLLKLRERNERAFRKCFGVIQLLAQSGFDLRRPHSDFLQDGVYELRTRVGTVNYRILYGFVGQNVALLSASFTKGKRVPRQEIQRAIARIAKYQVDPQAHGFRYEESDHNG